MATYDVKDVNGVEHLKLEESAVTALVESDQLTATCPMKKSPMPSWSKAAKFDFLTNALDEQRKRIALNAAQARSDSGMFSQKELTDQQKVALAEEEKFRPGTASPFLRLKAFLIDFVFALFKAVPVMAVAVVAVYFLAASSTTPLPQPDVSGLKQFKVKQPIGFVNLDSEHEFHAGSVFENPATGEKFICLSAEKDNAVWTGYESFGRAFCVAFLVIFAWEFVMLGWGLCTKSQTRGMRSCGLALYNAKDVRVELNGFQVFASVLVTLFTYGFAWIFVLILKRSPSELLTYSRCAPEV